MEVKKIVNMENFIIGIKILTMLAALLTNLTLFVKIMSRPSIHTIFNVSVACLFGITAFFGPFVVYFYFDVFEHQFSSFASPSERYASCARLLEFRNVIGESLKIISVNLMFRFFFVVHAEKGLYIQNRSNSTLMRGIYMIFTFGWTVSGYLSWPGSVMFSSNYPDNTVKGRICLTHRLDWDQDKRSKKTSDIYVKPRLIVLALIMTVGFLMFFMIHRVKIFIQKFCSSNRSHACIGGRYRRNILTFKELSRFYTFIIMFFLWDTILIFTFYFVQDCIGSDFVFFFYQGNTVLFDLTCIILLPTFVLLKSQKDFPSLWTNFVPKKLTFYATENGLVPRRELIYKVEKEEIAVFDESMEGGSNKVHLEEQTHSTYSWFVDRKRNEKMIRPKPTHGEKEIEGKRLFEERKQMKKMKIQRKANITVAEFVVVDIE